MSLFYSIFTLIKFLKKTTIFFYLFFFLSWFTLVRASIFVQIRNVLTLLGRFIFVAFYQSHSHSILFLLGNMYIVFWMWRNACKMNSGASEDIPHFNVATNRILHVQHTHTLFLSLFFLNLFFVLFQRRWLCGCSFCFYKCMQNTYQTIERVHSVNFIFSGEGHIRTRSTLNQRHFLWHTRS